MTNGKRILIVDDDTTLVEMLSEQLQLNEEFTTVSAELGADALVLSKKNNYDAIILDDVRDLYFLVRHQEKCQGKYDYRVEFGTTPGGGCAFFRWLWKVPLVVTANYTTKSLDLLETDDFLGNAGNRVVVRFHGPEPEPKPSLACLA